MQWSDFKNILVRNKKWIIMLGIGVAVLVGGKALLKSRGKEEDQTETTDNSKNSKTPLMDYSYTNTNSKGKSFTYTGTKIYLKGSTGFPSIRLHDQSGWGPVFSSRQWGAKPAYPHNGVDFLYESWNSDIIAITDGVVEDIYTFKSSKVILVKNSDGTYSGYEMLFKTHPEKGDIIRAHDILGIGGQPTNYIDNPKISPHVHFFVVNSPRRPGESFADWLNRAFIDPIPYVTAVIPELKDNFYFSPKYSFVMSYLWKNKSLSAVKSIVQNTKYDLDNAEIAKAVKAYEKQAGKASAPIAAKPVILKPGYINPNAGIGALAAQMQRLEPALSLIAVSKEGVWEIGYMDPDAKRVTGSMGVQNYTDRGPIFVGSAVPGFNGKFGLTEKEKQYAYEDAIKKYREEFYPLISKYVTRNMTDEQALVVADLFYQHGSHFAVNEDGTPTKIIQLINNPKSTDAQIIAELSKWRYGKDDNGETQMLAGSVLRRGFQIALWQGKITVRDLLDMESSAIYNAAANLDNYVFWKGTKAEVKAVKPGDSLVFKFNEAAWNYVKNYRYPDREGAFKNGQGIKNNKGGNIDLNRNMLPKWVVAVLEKTPNGLPEVSNENNSYLQDIANRSKKEVSGGGISSVSDKDMAKAQKIANEAVAKMDKYIKSGKTKDNENLWDKVFGTTYDDPGKLAQKALDIDPNNSLAKMVMVWDSRARGENAAAIELAKEIVTDPTFYVPTDSVANLVMAHTLLYAAQSYEDMGYPYPAYKNYMFANVRDSTLVPPQKIEDMWKKANETPKELVEARNLMAQNNIDAALKKASDFVQGEYVDYYLPQHVMNGYVFVAELREAKSQWSRSAANYAKAFEFEQNPDYKVKAAEDYLKAGNKNEAINSIQVVIFGEYYLDEPKKKAEARAFAGKIREDSKEYNEALINYTKANELNGIYGPDIERINKEIEKTKPVKPANTKQQSSNMKAGTSLLDEARANRDAGRYDDNIKLLTNKIENSGLSNYERIKLWFILAGSLEKEAPKKAAKTKESYYSQAWNAYNECFDTYANSKKPGNTAEDAKNAVIAANKLITKKLVKGKSVLTFKTNQLHSRVEIYNQAQKEFLARDVKKQKNHRDYDATRFFEKVGHFA